MQPIDWHVLFENFGGILIIFGVMGGLMMICLGIGLKLISRMEERRFRQQLQQRHEELWDGTASKELLAWLMVQRELEQGYPDPRQLELVKQFMHQCRSRHEHYRNMMLDSGQPINASRIIENQKLNLRNYE